MNYYVDGFEEQTKALELYLTELFEVKEPQTVKVYAFNQKGFRIAELSIASNTGGCSYMRSDGTMGGQALILAAEDFVLSCGFVPYRPEGWDSDIDEHADAKWKLAHIVRELTVSV